MFSPLECTLKMKKKKAGKKGSELQPRKKKGGK
jgi:hypothetical protein